MRIWVLLEGMVGHCRFTEEETQEAAEMWPDNIYFFWNGGTPS